MSSLVIAAHGTRLPEGQQACRALISRVRELLGKVPVYDCYVELDEPTIADAVATALRESDDGQVVVVPLMIGTGGHVKEDIPEGITAGSEQAGEGQVTYTEHLGPDRRLRAAVRQRIAAALGDWAPAETSVVFLGRGCSVPAANADHVRLGRLLLEEGGYADVVPGFVQVTQPNLTAALDRAYAQGGRRIVIMPHYLFPGLLQRWSHEQAEAWQLTHPDAEVRLADVIGDCDELAQVVAERYTDAVGKLRPAVRPGPAPQIYLSGLVLRDRTVLVAGGGTLATRRIDKLLAAGASVRVVAPAASEKIQRLAAAGELNWQQRPVAETDLEDVWYVLAATDSAEVNALVAVWAEARRVFCVRADDATGASAWTPATGEVAGLWVGVVGDRDPHRSARARSMLVKTLAEAS